MVMVTTGERSTPLRSIQAFERTGTAARDEVGRQDDLVSTTLCGLQGDASWRTARSGKRAAEAASAAAAAAIRFDGVRLRGTLGRSAGLVAKLGEIPSDGGAFGVIPLDAAGPVDTGVVGLGDTLTGSAGFSGVVGIRDGVAAAGRGVFAFERVCGGMMRETARMVES